MGVEPTRRRVAPPTGFEAQPIHQDCVPSKKSFEIVAPSCCAIGKKLAVRAQLVYIVYAAQ